MATPPNLLTGLVDIATAAIPGWAVAILSVSAAVAGLYVLYLGACFVLAALRGQVYYGGRFWDKDVYHNALQHLHTQRRRGVLLDAESHQALRRYQGFDEPSRRRYRGNAIPRW